MGNNITNFEPPKIMKFHKFAGKIVVRFWSKNFFFFHPQESQTIDPLLSDPSIIQKFRTKPTFRPQKLKHFR